MEIDGFTCIVNTVHIAKQLHMAGRKDLIDTCMNGCLHPDYYYEDMYNLISAVFSDTRNYYRDDFEDEIIIIKDSALTDYFVKAAEYGKRKGIPDDDNPYVKSIYEEANRQFNFSYAMDWLLNWRGLNMAARTRLAIWMSPYDFNEHDNLAFSLLAFQGWLTRNYKSLVELVVTDA